MADNRLVRIFSARPPQIDALELFAEQDGAIISGAMEDMDDDYLFGFHAVEDQVVAVNTPTDTVVLEAGNGGEAVRSIEESLTLAPQFPDE